MTTDIDKRLDEILVKDLVLATDNGQPYIKYTETAIEAIKQLMADEFEKLIGDDEYLTDGDDAGTANEAQNTRNVLRRNLRNQLKEWKQ